MADLYDDEAGYWRCGTVRRYESSTCQRVRFERRGGPMRWWNGLPSGWTARRHDSSTWNAVAVALVPQLLHAADRWAANVGRWSRRLPTDDADRG